MGMAREMQGDCAPLKFASSGEDSEGCGIFTDKDKELFVLARQLSTSKGRFSCFPFMQRKGQENLENLKYGQNFV
jgi:hypothetical protein